jgi:hypothetical protein
MIISIDSGYLSIIRKGTEINPALIPILSDTSLTHIRNTCSGGYFTLGQLSFFLINDIEAVPMFRVTKIHFDVFGECGLAYGVLHYLKNNGAVFKERYKKYFYSKERIEYLRQNKINSN